ncbi:transporter [Corynebacterium phocae]|uniref:Transporter n=1 Tax=Corynebacterium phocae TaxID=161895 RepID=A0A1L7D646_9CORY|nr:cation transporter [Corynebacterium phocae]APT93463.1 transporter [Corynebacterium phocae]KAA8721023.1 heavy-metal-associated domain-containing protein [Corynebacterium phocae]
MKIYTVKGMTCAHCEKSVQEEVGEITGVSSVTANATTGKVTVEGTDFNDEQVAEAIREAGYELA